MFQKLFHLSCISKKERNIQVSIKINMWKRGIYDKKQGSVFIDPILLEKVVV